MILRVRVPATSANLGSGFDSLGIALGLYNFVDLVSLGEEDRLEVFGEGEGDLSSREENLLWRAMERTFELLDFRRPPLGIVCHNAIPMKRGLGSSAAAVIGGIALACGVADLTLSPEEVLSLALEFEGHPDNITPCAVGGVVASCLVGKSVKFVKMPFPEGVYVVVAVPDVEVATEAAREALPREVSLEDAVYSLSRATVLAASLATGKLENLLYAMDDRLHQPFRARLFPGGERILEEVRRLEGCLGVAISGSGPSVLAFAAGNPHKLATRMCAIFSESGMRSRFFVLDVDQEGARIEGGRDAS